MTIKNQGTKILMLLLNASSVGEARKERRGCSYVWNTVQSKCTNIGLNWILSCSGWMLPPHIPSRPPLAGVRILPTQEVMWVSWVPVLDGTTLKPIQIPVVLSVTAGRVRDSDSPGYRKDSGAKGSWERRFHGWK